MWICPTAVLHSMVEDSGKYPWTHVYIRRCFCTKFVAEGIFETIHGEVDCSFLEKGREMICGGMYSCRHYR